MPVSTSSPDSCHPLSIVGYFLALGHVSTFIASIATLSNISIPFSDPNIETVSQILVISMVHAILQLMAYLIQWAKKEASQLNAHTPHLFHLVALLVMFCINIWSATNLQTPNDPNQSVSSIINYFRFVFSFNVVHFGAHSYWIAASMTSADGLFEFIKSLI